MRINGVKNSPKFGKLQILNKKAYFNESKLKSCEKLLTNTNHVDVICDSHGFSIKDKMTDTLHKIQSFVLYPQENAVSVNMIGEKNPIYKFFYNSIEEAKKEWNNLSNQKTKTYLEEYTEVALWLENSLEQKKGI